MPKRGWLCVVVLTLWFTGTSLGAAATPSWPPQASPGELGQHVNPFIGTGGVAYICGNNFPGAAVPFGPMRLNPDTVSAKGREAANMSGYFYHDPKILGFSHTRLVGTGAIDGGNFLVVPSAEAFSPAAEKRGLHATFSHDREKAFPGYYAVALEEPKLIAELTATRHVGVHRYTFADGVTPRLQIHVTHALGKARAVEGEVRVLASAGEVEGVARTMGSFSSRHQGDKVYFVARVNRPLAAFATWNGKTLTPSAESTTGDDVGAELTLAADDTAAPIELKLAISYVSLKNARENLESEVGAADFDKVLAQAVAQWEEHLGRARVEGGTPSQQTRYYTGLYHALQMPTIHSDANGEYHGFDRQTHKADGFNYYTDLSLWDTFRTVHPLYTLIAPREQRDVVVSLVEMARQGGYLPRWPSGGGYTNSMFGTPADMVIAEAYLKGIRDFDVETAYQAMRKTALGPTPPGAAFSGRKDIEAYLKYEYCPSDLMSQAVSRTLEYCYADHSIAALAEALGKHDDAKLFAKHAQYYRNLWNPETQYFQPRDSQGKFDNNFRPLMLTYADFAKKYTDDFVEGSALQWRWGVPYDAQGLISLFKSREYFIDELTVFFEKSEPKVGVSPNAYYWQGNQPDIYAAYLFNAAGRPDLTQKWTRWILEYKYGDGPNGLDGNDDGGTLSAWYVLSSLGLYPTAGSDRYELTSPLWKRAELKLGDKRLTIVADNYSPDNAYIQSATINGKKIDNTWITHAELAAGGELRFKMGPQPAAR